MLGAGFGGLELATTLSGRLGGADADTAVEVVLIDKRDGFVFGFSKLDVMFGRVDAGHVRHPYRDFYKPGVTFVRAEVTRIDPVAKRVETDAGSYDADVVVIALGADLHPAATPGLLEWGHDFYSEDSAFALRDVLASFGGGRVIIGVTSTPFKCPPAPSETALLMHEFLTARGLRETSEIALVMPLPVPIPPSPAASEALLAAFAERDISWHPQRMVTELKSGVARFTEGDDMPFDLFLGVPVHRVPAVVAESGLTVDGWIPVNPLTLETEYPGVFALGDVTSVGTPKAGVFSERQGAVAGERIAEIVGNSAPTSEYDGQGLCYLEFGEDEVARVNVTFLTGQAPTGTFDAPSTALTAEKADFGASRVRRWFGRDWANLG